MCVCECWLLLNRNILNLHSRLIWRIYSQHGNGRGSVHGVNFFLVCSFLIFIAFLINGCDAEILFIEFRMRHDSSNSASAHLVYGESTHRLTNAIR